MLDKFDYSRFCLMIRRKKSSMSVGDEVINFQDKAIRKTLGLLLEKTRSRS